MNTPVWKIVADENIPFVEELFGIFGEVTLLKGREITADDVKDAQILLVRSVTQVNQSLLAGSQVKFVGTCTIGIDHLDVGWLQEQKIYWSSAPGCNAMGVVQYVLSCLAINGLLEHKNKIAIIGCGNVGGRLYRTLKALGNECVCVDPFKDSKEIPDLGVFDDAFACDVVCFHAPLTREGAYPTFHMINEFNLEHFKPGTLLLNAGRGAVIDNLALLDFLKKGNKLNVVLDVWEPEPNINLELLSLVSIGTPHIAGYSYEGKVNGSLMIFDALCKFNNCQTDKAIKATKQNVIGQAFGLAENLREDSLTSALLATYNVQEDDKRLREQAGSLPAGFDMLRKTYPLRREPKHYNLVSDNVNPVWAKKLGFMLKDEE